MDFQAWVRKTARTMNAEQQGTYMTQAEVDLVMRYALEVLKTELADGGELSLVDIGRLYTEWREGRTVKSHLPGQEGEYHVPARRVVRFRVAKELRELVE
jgi:nucleoid DNA-binding protein